MPDGTEFEGVGVAPDVEVQFTIQDLREGHDRALEKARQIVKKDVP